jgi:hypothetical protein
MQVTTSSALQKRRGEEASFGLLFSRRTRRHCSSTVAAIPEVFLCNSWSFGGLFCKFKLFNVIFIYF